MIGKERSMEKVWNRTLHLHMYKYSGQQSLYPFHLVHEFA